ncbi:Hypothetical_protein [Hexamita inflata]|uniref:Hypothetical_protein n=1 Tax=Hexamita inflata TaxID=28002 RepID=A0AA86U0S0_9EUKA|nr:Hypothetical protein HINF_LOCUS25065 [Hexamita inflata]
MDSIILSWLNLASLGSYALSVFIAFVTSNISSSVNVWVKFIFLLVACFFTGITPWIKYADYGFQFLRHPFEKSIFMVFLGLYQFPCFNDYCWFTNVEKYQNVSAFIVIGMGVINFIISIIDSNNKENGKVNHDIEENLIEA